jgi:hypothetical protein
MRTELANRALVVVAETDGTSAAVYPRLGAVYDWRTLAELEVRTRVGLALQELLCAGLVYLSFPFGEKQRWVLTGKGRSALEGGTR